MLIDWFNMGKREALDTLFGLIFIYSRTNVLLS